VDRPVWEREREGEGEGAVERREAADVVEAGAGTDAGGEEYVSCGTLRPEALTESLVPVSNFRRGRLDEDDDEEEEEEDWRGGGEESWEEWKSGERPCRVVVVEGDLREADDLLELAAEDVLLFSFCSSCCMASSSAPPRAADSLWLVDDSFLRLWLGVSTSDCRDLELVEEVGEKMFLSGLELRWRGGEARPKELVEGREGPSLPCSSSSARIVSLREEVLLVDPATLAGVTALAGLTLDVLLLPARLDGVVLG
jgi:hypothetical protein